jgi:hypothetical protein
VSDEKTVSRCGHRHRSPVAALACDTMHELVQRTGGVRTLAVLIDDDDGPDISAFANTAGLARLAEALCAAAAHEPRPTDCDACAEAHDRLQRALAILKQPRGRCS